MEPFADCGLSTFDIASKDVPKKIPFWIVSSNDFISSLNYDCSGIEESMLGNPSGFGAG